MIEPTLRRLAALKPTTIALMHGPAFKGDGAAALSALADHYAKRLRFVALAAAGARPCLGEPMIACLGDASLRPA